MKTLKPIHISLIWAVVGYVFTIVFMALVMGRVLQFFNLTISAFIVSTLICLWPMTKKMMAASTPRKTIVWSTVTALLVAMLTAMLSPVLFALYAFAIGSPHNDFNTVIKFFGGILLYGGVGTIYALPGVLVFGVLLGRQLNQRKKTI